MLSDYFNVLTNILGFTMDGLSLCIAYQFNKTNLDVFHSFAARLTKRLYFSVLLSKHHCSFIMQPCLVVLLILVAICHGKSVILLPFMFLSMHFCSSSSICSSYCLLICIHNFYFERPTRSWMILRKWTRGLKQIRAVK